MFKKNDYIVVLKSKGESSCAKPNFCFKQREGCSYMAPYIDLDGDSNNAHPVMSADKMKDLLDWRYATVIEAKEYERVGKPYDVTTIWIPTIGDHVVITKSKDNWDSSMNVFDGLVLTIKKVNNSTSIGNEAKFEKEPKDMDNWGWNLKNKHYRKATQDEIKGYERFGEPYNINTPIKTSEKYTYTNPSGFTFEEGKVYLYDNEVIIRFISDRSRANNSLFFNRNGKKYEPNYYWTFSLDARLATPDEIAWLEACEKEGKYVDKPINSTEFIKDKWYKVTDCSRAYRKCSDEELKHGEYMPYNEKIEGGEFIKFGGTCASSNNRLQLLTDLSEIQEFLPNGHIDKIVKEPNEFKRGDYLVLLYDWCGHFYRKNYCFKQEKDLKKLWAEKGIDDSKQNDSFTSIYFTNKTNWRYATKEEIAEYDRLGKPFDVTKELSDNEGITKGTKVILISSSSHFSDYPNYINGVSFSHDDLPKEIIIDKVLSYDNKFVYKTKCEKGITYLRRNAFKLIEKMTKEQILEKGKRDYPVGTVFKSMDSEENCIINDDSFNDNDINYWCKENHLIVYHSNQEGKKITGIGAYIFRDGKWAEIISKPEEKWIPRVGDWVYVEKGGWGTSQLGLAKVTGVSGVDYEITYPDGVVKGRVWIEAFRQPKPSEIPSFSVGNYTGKKKYKVDVVLADGPITNKNIIVPIIKPKQKQMLDIRVEKTKGILVPIQ